MSIGTLAQIPLVVILDCAQEVIGQPNGIIAVLSGHGGVSFGVPVGVILLEFDVPDPLPGELDQAVDIVFWNEIFGCMPHGFFEPEVFLNVTTMGLFNLLVPAGGDDFLEVAPENSASRHHRGYFTLFLGFPVDELFDIRVVDI